MEPKTPQEDVAAALADFLKSSAAARTASLKMSGLTFTEELRKQLLEHAKLMETTYSKIKVAMEKKPDEKQCKQLKAQMEGQVKACEKMQAL